MTKKPDYIPDDDEEVLVDGNWRWVPGHMIHSGPNVGSIGAWFDCTPIPVPDNHEEIYGPGMTTEQALAHVLGQIH